MFKLGFTRQSTDLRMMGKKEHKQGPVLPTTTVTTSRSGSRSNVSTPSPCPVYFAVVKEAKQQQ